MVRTRVRTRVRTSTTGIKKTMVTVYVRTRPRVRDPTV